MRAPRLLCHCPQRRCVEPQCNVSTDINVSCGAKFTLNLPSPRANLCEGEAIPDNFRNHATQRLSQDTADMTPTRILLMRHAEKSGDPTDPHLNEAGHARAQRLADYVPHTFGPPDAIFATARSKHSNRPFETVEPLANKLGVTIDATFADQDYGALASTLLSAPLFDGRQILICWHHGNIPSLARSLLVKLGDCPDPWDYLIFNLILQIEYPNGDVSKTTCVTQKF